MPLLTNTDHYHQLPAKLKSQQKASRNVYDPNYITVLPSCNMPAGSPRQKQHSGGGGSASVYHNLQGKISSRSGTNVEQALLQQQQVQMSQSGHYVSSGYLSKQQQILQQNSPSLNHSNEYGNWTKSTLLSF